MSNSFGHAFRVTTWGESHGVAIGAVIDGCPPRLELSADDIQPDLDRRRPGQSRITTQRREADQAEILSGVFEGRTLGTPISIVVRNEDARGKDYEYMRRIYRPSHADYTYQAKYGIRNWRGGGRASARETIGRVAAGAVARKLLAIKYGVEVVAYVKQVAEIESPVDVAGVSRQTVDMSPTRAPDARAATLIYERIDQARKEGDSLGGVVEFICRGVPPGLGEPVFGKLDGELARAMLSLPAAKGFEIGSGFAGTRLSGATHNDEFYMQEERVRTRTNRSGGIQGGISNGEYIVGRVAFKPTATILKSQRTVDDDGNEVEFGGRGRHDPCVLPRAVPIVEAMCTLVLADQALRQQAQAGFLD
jgi:chorismate synthase